MGRGRDRMRRDRRRRNRRRRDRRRRDHRSLSTDGRYIYLLYTDIGGRTIYTAGEGDASQLVTDCYSGKIWQPLNTQITA